MKTALVWGSSAVLFLAASVWAAPVTQQIPYTKKTTLTYPKTYTFRFSLCDDPTAGNCSYWSEEKSIAMTNAKVMTYLGDTESLSNVDFGLQYYVQVDRKTTSGYKMVGTRDRLGVVPYALWSGVSDTATAGGAVTSVTAGEGLTSAGTTGNVTVNVGSGTGISVGPDAISVDTAVIQARVSGSCGQGEAIRSIDATGGVTCQGDTNSGGTVTQVDTGAGLTGGPITSTGSISIADNGIATAMLQDGAVTDAKIASADTWNDKQPKHSGAVYRWQEFDTYTEAGGWFMGNDPNMFGGVNPSTWTDSNGSACSMSSDKEVLRTLLTRKGYGGKNAVITARNYLQFSSTTGHVTVALFRIRNTTQSPIQWTPYFWFTAYSGWGETAGLALNGACIWTSGGSSPYGSQVAVSMNIPSARTSTVIFSVPSGPYYSYSPFFVRANIFAFYNNSLQLPAGLEYVDDFDTATGDWTQ